MLRKLHPKRLVIANVQSSSAILAEATMIQESTFCSFVTFPCGLVRQYHYGMSQGVGGQSLNDAYFQTLERQPCTFQPSKGYRSSCRGVKPFS